MHKSFKNILLLAPRPLKQALALVSDVFICSIAVQLAMNLRMEQHTSWSIQHTWMLLLGLVIFLPIFISMGLYRAIFRFAGLQVIFNLNKAMAVYALIYAFVFTAFGIDQVPRSVGLLQPMVFGFGIFLSRLLVRYWLGGFGKSHQLEVTSRALIYGAGSAGRQLAGGLSNSLDVQVFGYVDDDNSLQGQSLNGLPIYSPNELVRVVSAKKFLKSFWQFLQLLKNEETKSSTNYVPCVYR